MWETQGEHSRFALHDQRSASQVRVPSPPGCPHLEESLRFPVPADDIMFLLPAWPLPSDFRLISNYLLDNLLACHTGSQAPHVHAELLRSPSSVPAALPLKQWQPQLSCNSGQTLGVLSFLFHLPPAPDVSANPAGLLANRSPNLTTVCLPHDSHLAHSLCRLLPGVVGAVGSCPGPAAAGSGLAAAPSSQHPRSACHSG